MLVAGLLCGASCKRRPAREVGDPCVPVDEYSETFSGYSANEVSIDADNPACRGESVCLVNHFQGRVTCPYGQSSEAIESLPETDPGRCALPNATEPGPQAVAVPVRPQLVERRPEDAVYCSCRCADPDGNQGGQDYCRCPSGFSCVPLVAELGVGDADVAGSYCIRSGTSFDPRTPSPEVCSGSEANCGDPHPAIDVPPPEAGSMSTTVFLTPIVVAAVDKVDLLLVLDNSRGMADKLALFAQALPTLVGHLIDPQCRDSAGAVAPGSAGVCPSGFTPAFAPVADLHVGVVTSSLGGHGGIACSEASGSGWHVEQDDRGELIAPRRGVESFNDLGFLAWNTGLSAPEGSIADAETLVTRLMALADATGERGCGYEAPLEAWYRFLVDPTPPLSVSNDGVASVPQGINTTLLEQRAQFLRPDSLVAIVMLTDENDCSVRDDGPGFFVAGASPSASRLPRGTQACATDPNDVCCRSYALYEASGPPSGCAALSADPSCASPAYDSTEDHANLRCYEQKRRFGIDFLYPTQRYVEALTTDTVYGRACASDADCPGTPQQPNGGACAAVGGGAQHCRYTNPLRSENPYYADVVPRSDSELIFLAGIVGVPWQDVATTETLVDPTHLDLVPTNALLGEESLFDRWALILGDPSAAGAAAYPLDPFQWESVTPRVGVHALTGLSFPEQNPITGDRPLDPASAGAESPINGHELDVVDGGDLQYACTFPLPAPRDCPGDEPFGCDCRAESPNLATQPLCQEPGSTTAGTTQYFAKAYPGLRLLQVLKDYGLNSIVGSVCPKSTGDPTQPDYGYEPAARAIAARLGEQLGGDICLPRALADEEGLLACVLLEVTAARYEVSCDTPGRAPATPHLRDAAWAELRRSGRCDLTPDDPCADYTVCRLQQLTGAGLDECRAVPDGALSGEYAGYCYIDALQDRDDPPDGIPSCEVDPDDPNAWLSNPDCIGNPLLVAACPFTQRRALRFLSPPTLAAQVPFPKSEVLVGCQ